MRSFILYIYLLLSIFLLSCVYSKDVFSLHPDKNNGGEIGAGDFIQLNDGRIIKGEIQDFKVGFGLINRTGTITINNTKYNAVDIAIFQDDSNYYRKFPGEKYFMERRKVGKINLYYRHFKISGKYPDEYDLHYIQKGAGDVIQKFSVKLLAEMVADNPKASGFVEEYIKAKKKNAGLLDQAIDTYNNE
jgi:hypothetical protein